jgi:hypothetical protein
MSDKKHERFSIFIPDEEGPPTPAPESLELVDFSADPTKAARILKGGAYNPYDHTDTVVLPSGKPKGRRDLRKLSQWIKLKQEVEALSQENAKPPKD